MDAFLLGHGVYENLLKNVGDMKPRIIVCPTPVVIMWHQSMWIQWLFVKIFDQKVNDPNDP